MEITAESLDKRIEGAVEKIQQAEVQVRSWLEIIQRNQGVLQNCEELKKQLAAPKEEGK